MVPSTEPTLTLVGVPRSATGQARTAMRLDDEVSNPCSFRFGDEKTPQRREATRSTFCIPSNRRSFSDEVTLTVRFAHLGAR